MSVSQTEDDGVIGYHVTTVTPAIIAPMATAAFASMRILPRVLSMRSTRKGSRFGRFFPANSIPAARAAWLSASAFAFLPSCRPRARSISARSMPSRLREDAVVDHVAHEPAQLRVGADRLDEIVERHRVEDEVGADLVELQRLVVDDGGAGIERQHVLARRLRVHRDEDVDLLLAADVPVLVRADGVPGRQAGDVRREQVLAGHRDAHLEQRPDEHEVRRLAARPVDRRHLDAEVVHDVGVHAWIPGMKGCG